MPSSSFWTGILTGGSNVLQDTAARKRDERERERLQRERQQELQDALMQRLQLELATRGVSPSGATDPMSAMDLIASMTSEQAASEESRAESDELMELLQDNPRLAFILQKQGTDIASLADLSPQDLALLPALSKVGRQEVRGEKRERRQGRQEAVTAAEREQLELRKIEAEISSTLALARKRGVETQLAQVAERTGMTDSQVADTFLDRVDEYTKQKVSLEKILNDPFSAIPPAQEEAMRDQLAQLSGKDTIHRLALADVEAAQSAVRGAVGGGAAATSDPGDREAIRQAAQELRAQAKASAEQAKAFLVSKGYDTAIVDEIVNEEYGSR